MLDKYKCYKLKCFLEGDKVCIFVIFLDDFIRWWFMYLLMFRRYIFEVCLLWSEWWWDVEIIGFEWIELGELILFFLDGFWCKGNEDFVMYCEILEFLLILL